MEQLLAHEMALTKIQGSGDFQCHKCGSKNSISRIFEPEFLERLG